MTDEHSTPIKTPKQLAIVVLLAFAVPIALAAMLSQLVTSGEVGMHDNADKVLARIKPVGTVVLGDGAPPAASSAPAAAAAPGPMAAAAPAAAGPADGKKVYDSGCVACHGAGIAGAPKFGDKAVWAPRIQTGLPSLYNAALKGMGIMPPKGGNPALSDADVKAAVDFMVAAAK